MTIAPRLLLFVLVFSGASLATGLVATQDHPVEKPITVVLIRHAETTASTETNRDPTLSESGQMRANALARLLSKAGVTHVFASEYQRTQQTVAPLAALGELEVMVVSARDHESQIEQIREQPAGSVIVVAGHSNTIPALTMQLGGTIDNLHEDPRAGKVFDHNSYDRLIMVTLSKSGGVATQTIELRYGIPSSVKSSDQ